MNGTLVVLSALGGAIAASVIVFLAPRLVSYRLDEPPPVAPPLTLTPLAGVIAARWNPRWNVAFEIGTALLFVGFAARFGESRKLLLACAYAVVLLAIAYIDLEHRLVLNRLTLPGLLLGLAGSYFWSGIGIPSAALGAVTGLIIFVVLQFLGRGALGTGDTKLAVVIGAICGLPGVLSALLYGIVLGGLGAVFYLAVLKRSRKESMPYGPYLSAGAILCILWLQA